MGAMGSALLTRCRLAVMIWGGTYSLQGTFWREWCILKLGQLCLATNSCISIRALVPIVWVVAYLGRENSTFLRLKVLHSYTSWYAGSNQPLSK